MILFDEVTKTFRCGATWQQLFSPLEVSVFEGLSFDHPEGEVLHVSGPSGSGKSVLLDLIAGIYPPDSGTVQVYGGRPSADREVRRRIGMVRSNPDELVNRLSSRTNLKLLASWYEIEEAEGESRVEEVLDFVGLEEQARDVPLGELSPGIVNLVNIASGLISSPDLLLLDDPDRYLDSEGRDRLMQLLCGLSEQGMTLVLASQIEELVESLQGQRLQLTGGGDIIHEKI